MGGIFYGMDWMKQDVQYGSPLFDCKYFLIKSFKLFSFNPWLFLLFSCGCPGHANWFLFSWWNGNGYSYGVCKFFKFSVILNRLSYKMLGARKRTRASLCYDIICYFKVHHKTDPFKRFNLYTLFIEMDLWVYPFQAPLSRCIFEWSSL